MLSMLFPEKSKSTPVPSKALVGAYLRDPRIQRAVDNQLMTPEELEGLVTKFVDLTPIFMDDSLALFDCTEIRPIDLICLKNNHVLYAVLDEHARALMEQGKATVCDFSACKTAEEVDERVADLKSQYGYV